MWGWVQGKAGAWRSKGSQVPHPGIGADNTGNSGTDKTEAKTFFGIDHFTLLITTWPTSRTDLKGAKFLARLVALHFTPSVTRSVGCNFELAQL